MLTFLGFLMIFIFMILIMNKKTDSAYGIGHRSCGHCSYCGFWPAAWGYDEKRCQRNSSNGCYADLCHPLFQFNDRYRAF